MVEATALPDTRTRLLDAALMVIRSKGYAGTSVDDLCHAAGVTKGAFFHHFKSKEDMAVAAAAHFGAMAEGLFSQAGYRTLSDPLERLLAYVDFRKSILSGTLPEFTCLLGTLVQEAYETHPAIAAAANRYISEHATTLEADISAVMATHGTPPTWTAASLALYTQAVIQGAFILAKAKGGPQVAVDCLNHLSCHLKLLFNHEPMERT
ncbi:MAG: TetR/AcrR family transcriptional regulator [Aestuariivirga sp.]|nr:TetR/AcrR family transcriptional regulator [Aestuariivirga sp.]